MTSRRTRSSYVAALLGLVVYLAAAYYSLPALAQGINPNLLQTHAYKELRGWISYAKALQSITW
jgi:hypothetical protein